MSLGHLGEYVPAAFKKHVRVELEEARRRSSELLGIPYRRVRATRSDRGRKHRSTPGYCSLCSCPIDCMTQGCINCAGRDDARRRSGRPRLLLLQQDRDSVVANVERVLRSA